MNWKRGLIGILVVVVGGGLWMTRSTPEDNAQTAPKSLEEITDQVPSDDPANQEPTAQDIPTVVMVDVKGQVKTPDVYELPKDGRVKDAIKRAGGLTDEADVLSVNLAEKLTDQMVIYVPHQADTDNHQSSQLLTESKSSNDTAVVNINTATEQELMTLIGIGEAKAQQIIAYRQEHGLFEAPEGLKNVSGIGDKSFEAIKESVTIH